MAPFAFNKPATMHRSDGAWASFRDQGHEVTGITSHGDIAGQLASINYSDTTPDVTATYNRLGQLLTASQTGAATAPDADYTFGYHPESLRFASETITSDPDGNGPLPSLTRTIDRSRDQLQCPTGYQLKTENLTLETSIGYGYDVSGRLATLSAQGLPNLPGKSHAFEYTYEPGSSLLDKVTGPVHEVDNAYEPHRDVLLQKTNTRTVGTPAELSVIGYTVNAIGQREQRNLSGEIRADFYGGQTTDLYTTDWGNDALGQVIVHNEYDRFGNLTRRTGAPATRYKYRFSTKPRDPATGFYDYRYRWFDPYTGRWPSRDPIEERGGMNLYGFVGNDGIGHSDFLGKMARRTICCSIGWDCKLMSATPTRHINIPGVGPVPTAVEIVYSCKAVDSVPNPAPGCPFVVGSIRGVTEVQDIFTAHAPASYFEIINY